MPLRLLLGSLSMTRLITNVLLQRFHPFRLWGGASICCCKRTAAYFFTCPFARVIFFTPSSLFFIFVHLSLVITRSRCSLTLSRCVHTRFKCALKRRWHHSAYCLATWCVYLSFGLFPVSNGGLVFILFSIFLSGMDRNF